MLPSHYRTTAFFLITLTIILTYLPAPVSSFPIVVFQDRSTHVSNSSYLDDKLVFDVSFFLALLLALTITWAWIACRMTVDLFNLRINRILAASITAFQYLADQLSYLRFDTILHIAAAVLIDANEARQALVRRVGG